MSGNISARVVYLDEIYKVSCELACKIMSSNRSFDQVIAIARGGMLPARLMCDFFNIKNLSSIQIRHYESGAEQLETAEITDPLDVDVDGRKILIVDDVNDSGKTLETAVGHVSRMNPDICKTAVLHQKSGSSFDADYTGREQEEWKWLIYQWALTEDIIDFLKKGDMLDQPVNEALEYLNEVYQLEMEYKQLKFILNMKSNYLSG